MNQRTRRFIYGCAVLLAGLLSQVLGGTAEASQDKWELYEHKNRDIVLNGRANNPDRNLIMYDRQSYRYHTAQELGLLKDEVVQASLSSDTFIPIVDVYDANGRRLASGKPVSGNKKYKNEIVFKAPTDDRFVVAFTSVNTMAEGPCRIDLQLFRPATEAKYPKPDLTKMWRDTYNYINFKEKWYGDSQSSGKTIHVERLRYEYVDWTGVKEKRWVCTGKFGMIQDRRDVTQGQFVFVFEPKGNEFFGRKYYPNKSNPNGWHGWRVDD